MKHKIVRFTGGKARISITDDISKVVMDEHTLLNPDLSAVKGVSPELWVLSDGQIIPHHDIEERTKEIHESVGIIQTTPSVKVKEKDNRIETLELTIQALNLDLIDGLDNIDTELNGRIDVLEQSLIKDLSLNQAICNELESDVSGIKKELIQQDNILIDIKCDMIDLHKLQQKSSEDLSKKQQELQSSISKVDATLFSNVNKLDQSLSKTISSCVEVSNKVKSHDSEILKQELRSMDHAAEIKKLNKRLILVSVCAIIINILVLVLK